MGSNVISANTFQTFNGIAGTAITASDLVVNSEAGVLYPASTGLTMSQNNNTTSGPSAISANASVISQSGYGDTTQSSSTILAQLGNESIVSLYNGNGTTGTTNLNVYTRNLQGASVVTTFTISDSSISYYRVRTVNSTSYVVVWASSTSLKFAIYTNAGVVVKSTTTVATYSGANQNSFAVQSLTNGNIVFAYANATSGLSYAIYDSTGTVVLAPTVAEASSAPNNITIVKQSGGGFFIYYNNTSGSTYKFGRYNSSGTLQGSITTVASSVSNSAVGCVEDNTAVELSNGNVVFYAPQSGGYPLYYVYTSAGVLVASALNVSNSSATISLANVIPGLCATPNGFFVANPSNSSSRYFSIFDTSGNFVIQRKVATIGSVFAFSTTSSAYIRAFSNGVAGVTVHEQSAQSGCSVTYSTALYSFDNTGTQRGSTIVLQSSATNNSTNLFAIPLTDGSVCVTHRYSAGNGTTYWGSYMMIRKSILGVAQNTVSVNGTAIVYPQGNYTINQNMTFGGAFDNRTATVPGTKGTVVGTYAVLQGIS